MLHKRRGISPVVAIVILIAVAVALGIAVAFWATGLIGTLGQIEKLEVRVAYAETATVNNINGWNITLSGANTGTSDVTIVEITINGIPYGDIPNSAVSPTIPASINSGSDFTFEIFIPENGFTAGQTVEVALISGSGTTFKRTVVLP